MKLENVFDGLVDVETIDEYIEYLNKIKADVIAKANRRNIIKSACESLKHNFEHEIDKLNELVKSYNKDFPDEELKVNIDITLEEWYNEVWNKK